MLALAFRKYFVFSFDGKLYVFNSMPFGLSSAPRICTELLEVIQFALRVEISALTAYLDDFLLMCRSKEEAEAALHFTYQVFSSFGLCINTAKTEGPSQVISFLGILVDSISRTLACTASRIEELRSLLASYSDSFSRTIRDLRSLIGKLSFAAQTLPGARPYMRHMQFLLTEALKQGRKQIVYVDKQFQSDVRHWLSRLNKWNFRSMWQSARDDPVILVSDASLTGFGFYVEAWPSDFNSSAVSVEFSVNAGWSGSYSDFHAACHADHKLIGVCEILAVLAAAYTFRHLLRDRHVLFVLDNLSDVFVINRQATRSRLIGAILRELYDLANEYNFDVFAKHRAGVDNQLADFLSRPDHHQHDHIRRWPRFRGTHSADLCHVSLVSSQQVVSRQLSSLLHTSQVLP